MSDRREVKPAARERSNHPEGPTWKPDDDQTDVPTQEKPLGVRDHSGGEAADQRVPRGNGQGGHESGSPTWTESPDQTRSQSSNLGVGQSTSRD
jgi:hypothetical protein